MSLCRRRKLNIQPAAEPICSGEDHEPQPVEPDLASLFHSTRSQSDSGINLFHSARSQSDGNPPPGCLWKGKVSETRRLLIFIRLDPRPIPPGLSLES